MKHVAGLVNTAGTRSTVFALLRVQSPGSATTAAEQISTKAVSIQTSHLLSWKTNGPRVRGRRLRRRAGARSQDGYLMGRRWHAAERKRRSRRLLLNTRPAHH